ncbi:hypothetical protein vBPpSSYP_18 [Pseudomonas phage vB_PpS_SYP]|nr:hypothetical protein vBPpSSYP_18 [Pseudomonas phage vB_PpS_SYP]
MAKKELTAIEVAVAEWLANKGVKYVITGGTATKRDDWECDHWSVHITRTGKKEALIENYYTGVGHRQLTKRGQIELANYYKNATHAVRERVKAQHSVAVAPHITGVLYSLISDAEGAEQNFHDWCDSFGYDNDSIKALNTYNACCEILQKIRSFFTKEEREQLQELMQDY